MAISAALRDAYNNKKYLPLALRPKKTRAIRRRLTKHQDLLDGSPSCFRLHKWGSAFSHARIHGESFQLLLATKPQGAHVKPPTIVTEENIKLLFEIHEKVDGIRANYNGSLVSLTDIRMKPLGEACATQSILRYFS
ncbi:hypothetical protein L1987_64405 [Smallanthus sonchifolius]|uniref:Uncharacterized protein n=1 Tax=Smallanthus sonchifolius TaxID=185202 RepID=A0ACB9CG07_9ASTR|nr:hypothetical protein L1987_64405 [Smallanthus sonchifolius]